MSKKNKISLTDLDQIRAASFIACLFTTKDDRVCAWFDLKTVETPEGVKTSLVIDGSMPVGGETLADTRKNAERVLKAVEFCEAYNALNVYADAPMLEVAKRSKAFSVQTLDKTITQEGVQLINSMERSDYNAALAWVKERLA